VRRPIPRRAADDRRSGQIDNLPRDPTRFFNGKIDEVVVYSTALLGTCHGQCYEVTSFAVSTPYERKRIGHQSRQTERDGREQPSRVVLASGTSEQIKIAAVNPSSTGADKDHDYGYPGQHYEDRAGDHQNSATREPFAL
jgi:hypothetical protein